jgi:hypothetical protein
MAGEGGLGIAMLGIHALLLVTIPESAQEHGGEADGYHRAGDGYESDGCFVIHDVTF